MPKYGKKYSTYRENPKRIYSDFWDKSDLLDALFDIKNGNPSWGEAWYQKVQDGFYESAKILLAMYGKGNARNDALNILDKIIEMK